MDRKGHSARATATAATAFADRSDRRDVVRVRETSAASPVDGLRARWATGARRASPEAHGSCRRSRQRRDLSAGRPVAIPGRRCSRVGRSLSRQPDYYIARRRHMYRVDRRTTSSRAAAVDRGAMWPTAVPKSSGPVRPQLLPVVLPGHGDINTLRHGTGYAIDPIRDDRRVITMARIVRQMMPVTTAL